MCCSGIWDQLFAAMTKSQKAPQQTLRHPNPDQKSQENQAKSFQFDLWVEFSKCLGCTTNVIISLFSFLLHSNFIGHYVDYVLSWFQRVCWNPRTRHPQPPQFQAGTSQHPPDIEPPNSQSQQPTGHRAPMLAISLNCCVSLPCSYYTLSLSRRTHIHWIYPAHIFFSLIIISVEMLREWFDSAHICIFS